MRSTRKLLGTFVALAAVSLAASGARASFTATLNGYNLGTGNTTLTIKNSDNTFLTSATSGQGGQFNWTQSVSNPTPDLLPVGPNFISYCIQINQTVGGGGYTYTPGLIALDGAPLPSNIDTDGVTMGTVNAALMAQLWYNHQSAANGGNASGSQVVTGVGSVFNDAAANGALGWGAFQIAVWKLSYERTSGALLNLSAGNAIATNNGNDAEMKLAQAWLTELSTPGLKATLLAMADSSGTANPETPIQDQVVAVGGGGDTGGGTVPEPASVAVWSGMLLLGAVATLRRRRAARS